MLLIFYCPECKYSGAVPEEQISPGPVHCGPCHAKWGRKIQMRRDYTAEGSKLATPETRYRGGQHGEIHSAQ